MRIASNNEIVDQVIAGRLRPVSHRPVVVNGQQMVSVELEMVEEPQRFGDDR